jgi:hypothetical protein
MGKHKLKFKTMKNLKCIGIVVLVTILIASCVTSKVIIKHTREWHSIEVRDTIGVNNTTEGERRSMEINLETEWKSRPSQ